MHAVFQDILQKNEDEVLAKAMDNFSATVNFFQFDCTNTLNDQVLEKVTVQMEPSEGFEVLKCIPCPSLPYDTPGITYTLVRMPEDNTLGSLFALPL